MRHYLLSVMVAATASLFVGCGDEWHDLYDHLSNRGGGHHPRDEGDAGGALCPAIAYETNGSCEAPPGCEQYDAADCSDIVCTLIIHPTNGVCEAAPGCPQQDPEDCAGEGDAGAPQSCGSRGLEPCGEGEFCMFPPGASCGEADAPGTCQVPPEACTREYRPVCGCDGKTYSNACSAASARVSVRSEGACEGDDGGLAQTCGGFEGSACAVSEFCDYPPESNCGFGDLPGSCKPLPSCTPNYDPVCGCDGRTHADECQAHAAGVSVKHQGPCSGEDGGTAQLCGGFAGVQCPEDQFCDFPLATRCGSGDQAGTCRAKPELCTAQYDPVCGCDDRTYSNRCAAAAAGVSVARDGEC